MNLKTLAEVVDDVEIGAKIQIANIRIQNTCCCQNVIKNLLSFL